MESVFNVRKSNVNRAKKKKKKKSGTVVGSEGENVLPNFY